MEMFDRIDRHALLVQKMAETVEADLGEALIAGRIRPEGLRAAVLRCTRCEAADACEDWLDDHAATGADVAPDYCLNRELLARLRPEGR